MNKEDQVKELAAKVLNVFSYTEMKPEYLKVLDYTIVIGVIEYMVVTDGFQKYELILKVSENRMSWDLLLR